MMPSFERPAGGRDYYAADASGCQAHSPRPRFAVRVSLRHAKQQTGRNTMTAGYIGNRHPRLRRFLHKGHLLIRRISTPALDTGKHFYSISNIRHGRMFHGYSSYVRCDGLCILWKRTKTALPDSRLLLSVDADGDKRGGAILSNQCLRSNQRQFEPLMDPTTIRGISMPRALWKGAISFGLIYVPVELHTASKENALPLHMLDSRDFAPIGFHRVNKKTGKDVDWAQIVKGYEYKKGEFVALADADFKHANVKASETIEIDTFCDAVQIPAMYYEKPYYLAPAKGGDKVYALLRQALEGTGKVAVATFVMHQRQHLCAIAPHDSSLMLLTLRFADEVLPAREGKLSAKISPAELTMAKQLVQSMTGNFAASKFKDTYRADLKRRIQEKIKNKETHSLDIEEPASDDRPKAQVLDLMAALKASLNKSGKRAEPKTAHKSSKSRRSA
jgi:DNA end-binding protein Ku